MAETPKNTDEIFMAELKQEFMESVSEKLKQITSLYDEKKFDEIAKIAHDIKGTAGVFGMDEGTDIAKELQYAAQESQEEKTKALIIKITDYMRKNGVEI